MKEVVVVSNKMYLAINQFLIAYEGNQDRCISEFLRVKMDSQNNYCNDYSPLNDLSTEEFCKLIFGNMEVKKTIREKLMDIDNSCVLLARNKIMKAIEVLEEEGINID